MAILRGVAWTTYIRLRDHPGNDRLWMSYLDGTLLLRSSTAFLRASSARRLAMIVDEMTEALGISIRGTSTMTLRRQGAGKEPDSGFYFGDNARRMHNRPELDLEIDPPPDLTVEVVDKSESPRTLAIYSRLEIPEVWRYDPRKKTLWFSRLLGKAYEPIERSHNLPRLTPSLALLALDKIAELGETDSKRWIREWAAGLPEPGV